MLTSDIAQIKDAEEIWIRKYVETTPWQRQIKHWAEYQQDS